MSEVDHLTHLLKDGKRKNEFTVRYKDGNDKVKELDSVRLLKVDSSGVTVEEMKRLGKNRVYFIPHLALVYLRSEIF